ncbi:MAG: hypothetical protein KGH59_00865 [Candidatus Micrarchaeota archaeon]|nr:hypothetical protein [Candidatus Micrarchaeota archaeon]MDE1804323.1 hypothetical protein [Candidatus Micrarchaeota archaeon]
MSTKTFRYIVSIFSIFIGLFFVQSSPNYNVLIFILGILLIIGGVIVSLGTSNKLGGWLVIIGGIIYLLGKGPGIFSSFPYWLSVYGQPNLLYMFYNFGQLIAPFVIGVLVLWKKSAAFRILGGSLSILLFIWLNIFYNGFSPGCKAPDVMVWLLNCFSVYYAWVLFLLGGIVIILAACKPIFKLFTTKYYQK